MAALSTSDDQKGVVGYKVFNSQWEGYNRYQYSVGHVARMDERLLRMCGSGFHFCKTPIQCAEYTTIDNTKKYARVRALGVVVEDEYKTKCVTNHLVVEEEIPYNEFVSMCNGKITLNKGQTANVVWGRWESIHDEPSIASKDGTDLTWHHRDNLDRDLGPAHIHSDDKGWLLEWYQEGLRSRAYGPMMMKWDKDVLEIKYGCGENLHNPFGPARIIATFDGTTPVINTEWWLDRINYHETNWQYSRQPWFTHRGYRQECRVFDAFAFIEKWKTLTPETAKVYVAEQFEIWKKQPYSLRSLSST